MADLDFYASATPSVIVDDVTGSRLKPESDGSLPNDLTKVGGTAITLGQKAASASIPVVLPSDVSTPSEPSSFVTQKKLYLVSFDFNLASTGEKLMLHINNPSGSGKIFKLVDMTLTLTAATAMLAIFRLYVNPTITGNGSGLTISPGYVGASQPASSMLAYSGPTASANGTQYLAASAIAGTAGMPYILNLEGYMLAANNRLLLTGNPDGVNRNVSITLRWAEI